MPLCNPIRLSLLGILNLLVNKPVSLNAVMLFIPATPKISSSSV